MSRSFWVNCILILILGLSLAVAGMATWSAQKAEAACANLVVNGDMESTEGWTFEPSLTPGDYAAEQFFSPTRSVRLGITAGPNANSSSAISQMIDVPEAGNAWLHLRVYPISEPYDDGDVQEVRILNASGDETLRLVWNVVSNAQAWTELAFDVSEFMGDTITLYINVRNDAQNGITAMYVDDVQLAVCSPPPLPPATATPTLPVVTSTPTLAVVTNTPTPTLAFITATPTPMVVTNTPTLTPWVVTNTPTPSPSFVTATPTSFVVTATPTPTLWVVTNTPTFGPPFITLTPTPTLWVATNTATPTSWVISATPTPIIATSTPLPPVPNTPLPPLPTPFIFRPTDCKECLINTGFEGWKSWKFGNTVLKPGYTGAIVHSGDRAVALGNINPAAPNYKSYSSVRQKAVLPRRGFKTAKLTFWHYPISDGDGGDRQELIILDGRTGRTLEVLWRADLNDQTWSYLEFDLTRYLGRSIIIYFNVYNDGAGGRAAMYLDDVSLTLCPVLALAATPTPGDDFLPPPEPEPTFAPPIEDFPFEEPTIAPTLVFRPTPTFTPTPFVTIPPPPPSRSLWDRLFGGWRTALGWCLLGLLLLAIVMVFIVLLQAILERRRNLRESRVERVVPFPEADPDLGVMPAPARPSASRPYVTPPPIEPAPIITPPPIDPLVVDDAEIVDSVDDQEVDELPPTL